jgi:hypothetical protein
MKVTATTVKKLTVTDIKGLDPISIFLEDIQPGCGKIVIECFGKSWTSRWPAMGKDCDITHFFYDCDRHYLAKNLSPETKQHVYDADAIKEEARKKHIECPMDEPWNNHDFLAEMYGDDPGYWNSSMPTTINHEYEYLCKIIGATKDALKIMMERETA